MTRSRLITRLVFATRDSWRSWSAIFGTGQHRNPVPVAMPEWFTTAFLHRPEDICAEVEAAELELDRLIGVEGPGGWLGRWPAQAEVVLRAARLAEDIPALSAHMLAIARR
jgi:hypothetical protein